MFATWIFAAALFIQTVDALVHISKNGVTTKFVIEFEKKCKSRERKFTSLLDVSVGHCAEECGLRKHCVALNYEPCGDCAYGQVCDTATKQCLIKDCPPGWESFNGSCYLFSKEFRGWEDSKAFCELRKSHLVKVQDRNEDDYIRSVVSGQEYLHYYWIGLRFDTTNNEFRWTDGSTVTFNGWGPDRPGSITGCCNYLNFGSVTWQWNAHYDCVYTKGPCICKISY